MTAKKTTQAAQAKKTSAKQQASPKKTRVSQEGNEKRLSALAAAAKVLGETKKALTAQEMIDAMMAKGYWTSPKGKTPSATLYAALTREIKTKGTETRFQKSGPGRFTLA